MSDTTNTASAPTAPSPRPENGRALASLILGIVSLLLNILLVPSILGIVFGVQGLRRAPELGRRGMALTGLIMSIVGIPLAIGWLIFSVSIAASGVSSALEDTQGTTSAAPVDEPTTDDNNSPAPDASEDDQVAAFGESFTYSDGLVVTVTDLGKFTPSPYASMDKSFKHYEKFEVTIKNGTGSTFDPSMATADVSSADNEGDEVFDSDHSLNGSPSTKVLNGRSVHYQVGFGVSDPSDITFDFTPSFDYNDAIFQK